MEPKLAKELDALLRDDAAKTHAEAEVQVEFVKRFMEIASGVIVPAMKEFAEQIGSHGWTAEVAIQEGDQSVDLGGFPLKERATVQMVFQRGDFSEGDTPYLMIFCNKRTKDVAFFELLGRDYSGDHTGPVALDQITCAEIQNRLLRFFRMLISVRRR